MIKADDKSWEYRGLPSIYYEAFDNTDPSRMVGTTGPVLHPDERMKEIGCTYAYIYGVHIWEREQGKGYGRMMMNDIISDLESRGYKEIRLDVAGWNTRAINLYTSLGFVFADFYEEHFDFGSGRLMVRKQA
jgi:ribosomal protein S18 acetylase RimI-like enzyme